MLVTNKATPTTRSTHQQFLIYLFIVTSGQPPTTFFHTTGLLLTPRLVGWELSDAHSDQSLFLFLNVGVPVCTSSQLNHNFKMNVSNGGMYSWGSPNQNQTKGLLKIVSGNVIRYQEVVNKADSFWVEPLSTRKTRLFLRRYICFGLRHA